MIRIKQSVLFASLSIVAMVGCGQRRDGRTAGPVPVSVHTDSAGLARYLLPLPGILASRRIALPMGDASRVPGPTDIRAYLALKIDSAYWQSWADSLPVIKSYRSEHWPVAIGDSLIEAFARDRLTRDSSGYALPGPYFDPARLALAGVDCGYAARLEDWLLLECVSL